MRKLLAWCLAAVLAGCAANPFNSYGLQPGTGRDAALARLGQPTRVVRLPEGGERLQYSLQPFGQFAWMVDLDGGGRVLRSRQVLNATDFNRIELGKWTREDVDMFYWVYLDRNNVVQRAHPGMEFVNAPDRD